MRSEAEIRERIKQLKERRRKSLTDSAKTALSKRIEMLNWVLNEQEGGEG